MPNAALNSSEFNGLMQTVSALRAHYSTIANKAEQEMIAERMRGRVESARKYKDLLGTMHDNHKKALDLIAERLTTPTKLRETRRLLRSAADDANTFVRTLQQVKITLDKLAGAAGFLSELVRGLTRILA